MKLDIILAGVGGQGILSIATVIGAASMEKKWNIKQAEVHGMSQRGGDVQSNLRISSGPIYSDLIAKGTAHVIIALEPMEALRYKSFLREDGWIITSSTPFINIPNYPEISAIKEELNDLPKVVAIDVEHLAKEHQMTRSSNMILLGAAQQALGFSDKEMEHAIHLVFASKGENIVETNIKALALGREAMLQEKKK